MEYGNFKTKKPVNPSTAGMSSKEKKVTQQNAKARAKATAQAKKAAALKARETWIDITWALINSPEFMYRH